MTTPLHAHIIDRLPDAGGEGDDWTLLVVAALDGADALDLFLGGRVAPPRRPSKATAASPGSPAEPPGVYVQSIAVEGFRGIGPTATLTLTPGPGLTLVVGRNGCGKSSFAEGLEMLLTGANYRWAKRAKVWLGGWRNLHHGTPMLRADLIVEGQGPVAVTRTWAGEDVQQSEAVARIPGKGDGTLESLGWSAALGTFRPFLSYNELGSLLEDGPSRLYDALSSVLGLDDLTRVQEVLAEARKSRTAALKLATDTAKAIAASIERLDVASGDARPAAALRALRARSWDLGTLDALVAAATADAAAGLDLLRRLQSLPRPDVTRVGEAVQRLRAVDAACAAFAGSDAERSRQCAHLLRQALDFHRQHEGTTCPVCGTSGVLGAGWSLDTTAEIARLEREAGAVEAAERDRQRTVAEARSLVAPLPRELAQAAEAVSLDSLPAVRAAWGAWAGAREITSATALADHLEAGVLVLDEAVGALIDEAGLEAARREDTWRPVHREIVEWLPRARLALEANAHLATIKKAEEWMKSTADALRAERFRPIADKAIAVWQQLRLQSNVDLGNIELEGRGTRRAWRSR